MKKNLLSILILALVVVNLLMTAFLLFSVMSTNSKAGKLVQDVAAALELEANSGMNGDGTGLGGTVNGNIADRITYNLQRADGNLTFALKPDESGQHYAVVTTIILSLDTSNPDYKTYGSADLLAGETESLISRAGDVFARHTVDELMSDQATIRQEVLTELQAHYGGSKFIYEVAFSGLLTQ